jgi:hypothetical protein
MPKLLRLLRFRHRLLPWQPEQQHSQTPTPMIGRSVIFLTASDSVNFLMQKL